MVRKMARKMLCDLCEKEQATRFVLEFDLGNVPVQVVLNDQREAGQVADRLVKVARRKDVGMRTYCEQDYNPEDFAFGKGSN
jgi:hypothetical protein